MREPIQCVEPIQCEIICGNPLYILEVLCSVKWNTVFSSSSFRIRSLTIDKLVLQQKKQRVHAAGRVLRMKNTMTEG
jgi:hypothetical protein